MKVYRLSIPTLVFSLFAMAASAATTDHADMSRPSMEKQQTVAASMPQANNAPSRVAVTVAPPATAASSLFAPQYWWKDR